MRDGMMPRSNGEQTLFLLRGALALALAIVSLTFFRGSLSMAASLTVPAALILFSAEPRGAWFALTGTALLVTTLLFFQTQIFFVLGYVLLAAAFDRLVLRRGAAKPARLGGGLAYLGLVMLALHFGFRLTQNVFGVPLYTMMMRFAGGESSRYLVILLLEGGVVAGAHFLWFRLLGRRIRSGRGGKPIR